MELQLLGLAGAEVAPAVVVSTGIEGVIRPLYLFNAPEGLARAALEHRVLRPSRGRIVAVFLSGLAPNEASGLPGLILRGRSDGADASFVCGPRGTIAWLHAHRHVVRWAHPELYTVEWGACGCGRVAGCCHGTALADGRGGVHTTDFVYRDGNVAVHALGWICDSGHRCAGTDESSDTDTDSQPLPTQPAITADPLRRTSHVSCGDFVRCVNEPTPPTEAVAPGAGSTRGSSCTSSANGRTTAGGGGRPGKRSRQDSRSGWSNALFAKAPMSNAGSGTAAGRPTGPPPMGLAHVCECADGGTAVIVTCRDAADLERLAVHPTLARFIVGRDRPLVVVHCVPVALLDAPAYAQWKASLGPLARHIDAVAGECSAAAAEGAPPHTDDAASHRAGNGVASDASTTGVWSLSSVHHVLHVDAAVALARNHRRWPDVFPRATAAPPPAPWTDGSAQSPSPRPPTPDTCAPPSAEGHDACSTGARVHPLAVFDFDGVCLSRGIDYAALFSRAHPGDDDDVGAPPPTLTWVDAVAVADDDGVTAEDRTSSNYDAAERMRRELMGDSDDSDVDPGTKNGTSNGNDTGNGMHVRTAPCSVATDHSQVPPAAACKETSCNAVTVTFLGTGCAEPSKHRASSAILVCMPVTGGRGTLLLDAGEGTAARLVSTLGDAGARNAVATLGCVWISHHHPDHCAGVLGVVAMHAREHPDGPPLVVVGPQSVGAWLVEATAVAGLGKQIVFCPFQSFVDAPGGVGFDGSGGIGFGAAGGGISGGGGGGGGCAPRGPVLYRQVLEALGLSALTSIPVDHCHDAHAAVVTGAGGGWRVVYSGDTRPCPRLARAGAAPTLLIHEATFNPDMHKQAVAKRHCTTDEALRIAAEMQAWHVVLTHFSQRTRHVLLPHDATQRCSVVCAQDGMVITLPSTPL